MRIPVGRLVGVSGCLALEASAAAGGRTVAVLVSATSPDWAGTRSGTVYPSSPLLFELPAGRWRLSARADLAGERGLEGNLDLGLVDADRKDVTLPLREVER